MAREEMRRWIVVCAVVEMGAWGAAWLLDWSTPAVAIAVVATVGVSGVIFALQRRQG